MRKLDKIILHCADTGIHQDFSVGDIRAWHLKKGWYDIGYHFYIKLDGSLHEGRPLYRVGSHCRGYNTGSIGVCFEGGKYEDGSKWTSPMDAQIDTVKSLIQSLRNDYGDLTLHGHYEFSSKSCPNFNINCIF